MVAFARPHVRVCSALRQGALAYVIEVNAKRLPLSPALDIVLLGRCRGYRRFEGLIMSFGPQRNAVQLWLNQPYRG